MSLRAKLAAIVAIIVLAYGVVDFAVQRRIIYPNFVALEREEAVKDLRRCIEAVEREVQQLDSVAGDYGAWNETCEFAADRNQRYVEAYLSASSLKNLGVNVMSICGPKGEVLATHAIDLETQEALEIPDFPKDRFPEDHILVHHEAPESASAGIFMTGSGPMLVASRPILTDKREGPVRGAVITGRLLNEGLLAKLRDQTKVRFDIQPVRPSSPTGDAVHGAGKNQESVAVQVVETDRNTLTASATLMDIHGAPAIGIRASIARNITARGQDAIRFANYSLLIVGVSVLAALLLLMQWAVLGPVSRLTNHAVRVGRTGDLTSRLNLESWDEIGQLAAEFNRMVERLAEVRKRLVEQSYESGIAEMASGTLHNVRNALTPVLVEIDLLRQELSRLPMDQIEAAKAQLGEEAVPEERRRDLATFLDLAHGRLAAVARETNTRLGGVAGRAKQIEQILSDQEGSARSDRPTEWVSVEELAQDAATLLPAALRERMAIEIAPGVAGLDPIRTNRICLLQVFQNLLVNAAEAIGEAGKSHGTVRIDAAVGAEDGTPKIHVRFDDDGAGIAPDHLARIFERGFSTKARESRGLGLHWCANSVAAMGGRMVAESAGPGQGASLHVILPMSS